MSSGTWRDPPSSGEPNLSEPDLRDWVEQLAPSNRERRKILTNLLYHANADRMTLEDRQDCRTALLWIESGLATERAAPVHLAPVPEEPE